MAVKIRLTRMGAKGRPFYRIVATDSHRKRDGEYIVILHKISSVYDKKRFSEMLVHRRKLKGISTEKLANLVGVHKYTASNWEGGRFMPNPYNLERIMNILNISEKELERCQI